MLESSLPIGDFLTPLSPVLLVRVCSRQSQASVCSSVSWLCSNARTKVPKTYKFLYVGTYKLSISVRASLGLALPLRTSHVVLDVRLRLCVVALKWNRTVLNLRVEKLNLDVKKDVTGEYRN